ncbi:MFS transporter [Paenarthrobacter sp. PH39-S1]|uniref:MFS transporter n=1 Tax=Paenarthrobacter sp. PH39-S1 TaxID=3046204 RepID=UPI0024B9373D|nr:MFS transporter [Paenarthrobacter sp. PH39-S1]MDJ0358169.1 MFS transporter [Paenarthrobacter sp. PH39-S1]
MSGLVSGRLDSHGPTLIANFVFMIVTLTMPEAALVSWGWRIPFLASAILIGVGLWVRLSIEETPALRAVKETGVKAALPFAELMRKNRNQVLLGAIATLSTGVFNILVAVAPSFGKNSLGYTTNDVLLAVVVSCFVGLVAIPFFGWLSDKVGRKTTIIGGMIGQMVLAFPVFWRMGTHSVANMILGYVLMRIVFSANYAPPQVTASSSAPVCVIDHLSPFQPRNPAELVAGFRTKRALIITPGISDLPWRFRPS